MTKKEIERLIKELKRKGSNLLPDKPMFFRAILAQRLEDEKEEFINHPFFADETDVQEALLKEFNN